MTVEDSIDLPVVVTVLPEKVPQQHHMQAVSTT
jgi:hypothetical protein